MEIVDRTIDRGIGRQIDRSMLDRQVDRWQIDGPTDRQLTKSSSYADIQQHIQIDARIEGDARDHPG